MFSCAATTTQQRSQQQQSSAYNSSRQHNNTTTTTTTQHITTANQRSHQTTKSAMKSKAVKRPGVTPEMMYGAKKRAITMMAAVAVNPPGSALNVTVEESEEIAFRCLLALAKLAHGDSAGRQTSTPHITKLICVSSLTTTVSDCVTTTGVYASYSSVEAP